MITIIIIAFFFFSKINEYIIYLLCRASKLCATSFFFFLPSFLLSCWRIVLSQLVVLDWFYTTFKCLSWGRLRGLKNNQSILNIILSTFTIDHQQQGKVIITLLLHTISYYLLFFVRGTCDVEPRHRVRDARSTTNSSYWAKEGAHEAVWNRP